MAIFKMTTERIICQTIEGRLPSFLNLEFCQHILFCLTSKIELDETTINQREHTEAQALRLLDPWFHHIF